ncbi:MAG: glycosyltransferase [Isosphaeraceae bacterium]|nr:glycosyltransferase [Isosphaeraceae bacterium]
MDAASQPFRPRVALVHDWLTGMRGGEKCLEVLCREYPESNLHTLLHARGKLSPAIESMAIRTSILQAIPGVARHYRKLLPLMPAAARGWRVGAVDVVVSLSHCVAKSVRVPEGVPHVCYCFTPMRYAWEGRSAYLETARAASPARWAISMLLDRLREWDRASAAGVTHFVAISRTIQERIARCYGRSSTVIEPPVDTRFYTPARVDRGDEYLYVGALVPYKKVDQAIAACNATGRRLTVIGDGPEFAKLQAAAGPTVRMLGRRSDEEIREHYRTCRALLFPGEEDFGIVPIEALACGAPVIALGRGGAAETVDDRVGRVYAEPTTEALIEAVAAWEREGRPHDAEEARARAERLDTEVFRSRITGLIESVARGSEVRSAIPAPHHRHLGRKERAERF